MDHNMPVNERELLISVLISTHRRPLFLLRLLQSIRQQHYRNCEIIIVDDASNDETAEVVQKFMHDNPDQLIIFLQNEYNLGVGESKKRAYLKSRGDIIIFTDDDDYYIDPSYFHALNQIYLNHSDCSMTIAATVRYYEKADKYVHQELNTPGSLSCREYLNGFMGKYKKPDSIFTMSLKSSMLKEIRFEELKYFNDTSIYLFGLLGNGNVYTMDRTVGVYYISGNNMTGNTSAGYTLANLEAKEDIYLRAKSSGLLDKPREWHYRNLTITAGNHLVNNKKLTAEDKAVWKWLKAHFDRLDYYRFKIRVMAARLRLATLSGPAHF